MDRLPKEHLLPDPPQVQDMQVGDVRWIGRPKVDHEGVMYLHKKSDTKEKPNHGPVGTLYEVQIERLEEGWKVLIPRCDLPLKPMPQQTLEPRCFRVTDIEIVG